MASGTVVSADVNSDIKSAKQEAKVARDVLEKYESDLTSLNKQKKDAETKLKQAEKAVENAWKPYRDIMKATKKTSSEFRSIKNAYDESYATFLLPKEKIEDETLNIKINKANIQNAKNDIENRIE